MPEISVNHTDLGAFIPFFINPYVYIIFLHIDNEELLLPNPYDYP
jgi:hypothetical protein